MAGRVRHGSNYTSISSGDPSDFVGPIRSITFEEWVQPLITEFIKYETKIWKKKNIHREAHVIALDDETLLKPDINGDTTLIGETTPAQVRMEAIEWVKRRQPGKSKLSYAGDIHEHNLLNIEHGKFDYVAINNFRQSEGFFKHMKKKKLMNAGNQTQRGHDVSGVRLQGEAEMAKLKGTTTAQASITSGKIREKNNAYIAAKMMRKALQAQSDSLSPTLSYETKFDIDRRTKKIKGVSHLIIIAPETKASNLGTRRTLEGEHKNKMRAIIDFWVAKYGNNRINITGSKTPMQAISQTVSDMLMDKKSKGYKQSKRSKIRTKRRIVPTIKVKHAKVSPLRTSDGKFTSPMNIQAILNAKVKEEVADNMGKGGALVYRTGRFANSVSVTKVMQSRQGALTAFYTYMKAPYQTFERGYAQGSLRRDPRKLIAASIREIARETLNHKLQIRTRRV